MTCSLAPRDFAASRPAEPIDPPATPAPCRGPRAWRHAPPSLAIFGFGAFGELAARMLAPHMPVSICEPDPDRAARARAQGFAVLSPAQAARAEIVALAVPVARMAAVLDALAPHLRPGALVVDTASVKEIPARLMAERLPAETQLLATHPLFGPSSVAANDGGAGLTMTLCPLRGRAWTRVAAFLRARLGLRLLLSTPEAHDREMALTQGLVHLLARAFAGQKAPRQSTLSFRRMQAAFALVLDDAPELYETITRANPHMPEAVDWLTRSLREVAPAQDPAPEIASADGQPMR